MLPTRSSPRTIHVRGLTNDGMLRVRVALNGRRSLRYEWHFPTLPTAGLVLRRRNGERLLIESVTMEEDGVWLMCLRVLATA